MRYRPNMDNVNFAAMSEVVDKVDSDTGVVVSQNFFPMREKLPPVENFDLTTMIKAGVDLKQVNSKVIGNGIMEVADNLSSIDDDNLNKNNNEVNNE